ncbi:hypothetical protein BG015_003515 [Linnemannia schmuckeri]|uniref:Uncharacterized protein n=1 Tax=Linnemannia schmuckeri TaxID=64567 RepID=A0A9P5RLJ5_9FUNG|nr:hypothetical protein BG015_003515 [Linnemannia schmuckeri]
MTSVLFYNPGSTPEELAHTSPPSHNDANWPWSQNNNHPHDHHRPWKEEDTKPSKSPNIPGLARLNILQGFSLLGGAGSVIHEIHAVEYQKAMALASSSSSEGRHRPRCAFTSAETDATAASTTTDVTVTEKETTEGAQNATRGAEQLWPWSWAQKLQSVTTGSRGTMKRYRITIEELPGEVSVDGSPLASTSTSASATSTVEALESGGRVKKVATTTAMMPMGVVEWLLNVSYDKPYGFRTPAVEEKKGGDESNEVTAVVVPVVAAVEEVVVPQVPLPDYDLSSSSSIPVAVIAAGTVTPPTVESPGAGPEPVATKIESPPTVVATPSNAVTTAVVDHLAVASAALVPAPPKSSEAAPSSVLVNKVMEVRPSWDTTNNNTNNTSQDASRTKEWPPRHYQHERRPSESFTRTTITRPDGTIESKTVTFNRQSGVTETHTRIQRPDGSFLESSTHRINPSSREIQVQAQEQQGQQVPQTRHEGGNPYRNHLNRAAAAAQQQQQHQQEKHDAQVVASTIATAAASTPPAPSPSSASSQHRPSFRERWAQRRQEHREFLEELRAERERERRSQGSHDQERGRQDERRRERRQELRDAEARQREATAAAYGFVPSASSSNSPHFEREREDNHHHRDRLRRRDRKVEDEEVEDEGRQVRSRSWPPKGYLKRQEREQQEQQQPCHNV